MDASALGADLARQAVVFIFGGGLYALLNHLRQRRLDRRSDDREDRAEPVALGQGAAELADLLTDTAAKSVQHMRDELDQTRKDMARRDAEHRAEVERRDREHLSVVSQLRHDLSRALARIQQLIDALTGAGVPVPDERQED